MIMSAYTSITLHTPTSTVAGPVDTGCLCAKLGSCYAGVDAVRDKLEPGGVARQMGRQYLDGGIRLGPWRRRNDGWFEYEVFLVE